MYNFDEEERHVRVIEDTISLVPSLTHLPFERGALPETSAGWTATYVATISQDWQQLMRKGRQLMRPFNRLQRSVEQYRPSRSLPKSTSASLPLPVFGPVPASKPSAVYDHPASVDVSDRPNVISLPHPISVPQKAVQADVAPNDKKSDIQQSFATRLHLTLVFPVLLVIAGLAYRAHRDARFLRDRSLAEQEVYEAAASLQLPQNTGSELILRRVLEKIETTFCLRSAALLVLSNEDLQVEQVHTSRGKILPVTELFEAVRPDIHSHAPTRSEITLWQYPEQFHSSIWNKLAWLARPQAGMVTVLTWPGEHFGVVLLAQCQVGRRSGPDDGQALHLATQLMASAITANITSASHPVEIPASDTSANLADHIAHEFNNLLTSINGYAEMAAEALRPGSSPHIYVEHIQKTGDRARRVIEQMLEKNHGVEGSLSFDVVAATAEILPDVEMCVPRTTLVSRGFSNRPMHIYGSPVKLQQAILNLCKNAGEAMKSGGRITVKIRTVDRSAPMTMSHGDLAPGSYVRVSVEDTGPGIAKSDLKRIFDPYVTTKTSEGGTGLGLPMVSQIVQLLNGVMDVRSNPQTGTHFDLYFPAAAEKHSRTRSRKKSAPHELADTALSLI